MFNELAPVLRHRAVLMTITSTEDDQIRVNVVPKKLKDDERTRHSRRHSLSQERPRNSTPSLGRRWSTSSAPIFS
jgi:hypothetical protein